MPRVYNVENPKGTAAGISNSRRRRRKTPPKRKEGQAQQAAESNDEALASIQNVSKTDEKTTELSETEQAGQNENEPPRVEYSETTKTTGTMEIPTHSARLALAVDTRVIVANDVGSDICNDAEEKARLLYKNLLQDLASSGALPNIVTATSMNEPSKIELETEVIRKAHELEFLSIKPAIFQIDSSVLTDLPKACVPKNSWKLLRGLGTSIHQTNFTAAILARLLFSSRFVI